MGKKVPQRPVIPVFYRPGEVGITDQFAGRTPVRVERFPVDRFGESGIEVAEESSGKGFGPAIKRQIGDTAIRFHKGIGSMGGRSPRKRPPLSGLSKGGDQREQCPQLLQQDEPPLLVQASAPPLQQQLAFAQQLPPPPVVTQEVRVKSAALEAAMMMR